MIVVMFCIYSCDHKQRKCDHTGLNGMTTWWRSTMRRSKRASVLTLSISFLSSSDLFLGVHTQRCIFWIWTWCSAATAALPSPGAKHLFMRGGVPSPMYVLVACTGELYRVCLTLNGLQIHAAVFIAFVLLHVEWLKIQSNKTDFCNISRLKNVPRRFT